MKLFLHLSLLSLFATQMNAQVGIGNTDPKAALEITSATDGLLIPRVALTATTVVLPVLTGMESELVYNTATAGDVTPGFYYLSTATGPWIRVGGSSAAAWLTIGNTGIVDGTNFIGTAASTNIDVAFRRNNAAAGKIGATSTSFGVGALSAGATTNSTAIGNNALSVSTGQNNVAVGQNALRNCNTTAQWNTAVGVGALQGISSNAAQYNTAVGYNALGSGTGNFSNNTAVGVNALVNNAAGGINNTGLGYIAGTGITTGYNNTAIGYNAQVPAGGSPNQVQIGDLNVTWAGCKVAWSLSSDRRWKENIKNSQLGLDFIQHLRPVSYTRINDANKKTEYGFIAQEVEESLIKAGDSNNGIITKDDNGMYSVRYNDFIPMTIKAVQEQQIQIEELKKQNEELQKTNTAILKRLEALEKK